jgi:general secretion pathway protein C
MVEPRKLPVVAIVLASASLVVAIVAVGIIATRDPAKPTEPAAKVVDAEKPDAAALSFVDVSADAREIVRAATAGTDDAKLRKTLGLEPGDAIVSVNGRKVSRPTVLRSVVMDASIEKSTALYVEVERAGKPVLVRWRVSGDLYDAFFDTSTAGLVPPPPPAVDPYAVPRPVQTDDDVLLAKIDQIDDEHVEVPREVVDAVLANPMAYSKGARVVPSIKDGKPNGMKLYAIRPNSLYAKLGLKNGDTLKTINGFDMTSADRALEVYTKLRDATSLELEIDRRGVPITVNIKITK